MSASEWGQVAEELREKMVSIEIRANNVLVQLTGVCRTWESLKVDILEARLEEDRRLAAMAQGVRVLQRDHESGVSPFGPLLLAYSVAQSSAKASTLLYTTA